MEGVTILNQYQEIVSEPNMWIAGTVGIVCVIISLVYCISKSVKKSDASNMLNMVVALPICAIIFMISIPLSLHSVKTGRMIYQVTISEEVRYIEFDSKYEVLEVNGKIYSIVERDNIEEIVREERISE